MCCLDIIILLSLIPLGISVHSKFMSLQPCVCVFNFILVNNKDMLRDTFRCLITSNKILWYIHYVLGIVQFPFCCFLGDFYFNVCAEYFGPLRQWCVTAKQLRICTEPYKTNTCTIRILRAPWREKLICSSVV